MKVSRRVIQFGLGMLGIPAFGFAANSDPVLLREFISTSPPTRQSHASTIVETPEGLVVAWFGGEQERDPGVGVWIARQTKGRWSVPVEVADGQQPAGRREPAWNPVLFRPHSGPLMLFYKVGPDPQHWWGMLMTSTDNGVHWSNAQRLPHDVLGPIKNKPVQLADGSIVSPSSTEQGDWRIHFERSTDLGKAWLRNLPIDNPDGIEAIQPSLLPWHDGDLQAIGRTRQDSLFTTRSKDNGHTWSVLKLLDVPNPNSGIDAVLLADGRALLVYNPTTHGKNWWDGRGVLAVAISSDGEHWKRVLTLETNSRAEFSYPAIIQTSAGIVHITYTWKRLRIAHVVLDPHEL
ncbi:sialidase family protein [Rhodanobacter sp. C01]|uniref:sialidase family protein n=1 Tax=Rhodanobacter sp. C01 TaxID=1945856 RepID=UPI00098776CB|nr:sialidase family protein [Rhodanobacter sp. C01]OOG47679.1 exo-alpha-sialidase [Rhodanobacter sp. C01]